MADAPLHGCRISKPSATRAASSAAMCATGPARRGLPLLPRPGTPEFMVAYRNVLVELGLASTRKRLRNEGCDALPTGREAATVPDSPRRAGRRLEGHEKNKICRIYPNELPDGSRCSVVREEKAQCNQLAGGLGFEPRLAESESCVVIVFSITYYDGQWKTAHQPSIG
jgi:hypothetical protein